MSNEEAREGGGKIDASATTMIVAALFALGVGIYANTRPQLPMPGHATNAGPGIVTGATPAASAAAPSAAETQPQASVNAATSTIGGARPQWAASATGRIEPKDGELRLAAPVPARIVEVLAKSNMRVPKSALLVRLDDEDAQLKVIAANSETDVRKRERDEEIARGAALERRNAEDSVADAERALFRAKMAFDAAWTALRNGKGSDDETNGARVKISQAEERLGQEKGALVRVAAKAGMPLPTRLESALQVSRADTSAAEAAVEKLRVRAPYEGTVLNVAAKVGELSQPSPDTALITYGDLGGLRVRAEVEERDATKVRVGQKIVVKVDAYPGREFEGEVTSVSQALATPRIVARGPRRPNDVEVLEVLASLDGAPPLLTGMRVDVFFKLDKSAEAGTAAKR